MSSNSYQNVMSIPSFQPVRIYHAHSATITAVSVSPYPVPFFGYRSDQARVPAASDGPTSSPARGPPEASISSPRTPRQPLLPNTPSNSIYIATSSIDGHVCVASLMDPKDVMLRNFSRPVQAVALSPEFKSDRTYLSGGLAGNLILTIGGKSGVSANANTNSAAAAASGWLSTIGLSSNTGRDRILHSGEGAISIIKWSLSGKFVVWVNEHGIKIMRTGMKLQNSDLEYAWSRIAHIDRPSRAQWEEMANVWKPRAEWIDESRLERDDDDPPSNGNGVRTTSPSKGAAAALEAVAKNGRMVSKKKLERLIVGWGDAVWILQVKPESKSSGREPLRRSAGSATIVHQ
jgi:vacuolar protein sorting-associated protein 41